MKIKNLIGKCISTCLVLAFILSFFMELSAQVSYYQYRKVPPAKVDEFIKRETTYWSKVAQKAVDNDKMIFWGLFQKVSGGDAESPNFLFINSFQDIDLAMSEDIWNAAKLFPTIPMAKMETYSFSTVSNVLFTKREAWEQAAKAVPDKDFNYVLINYHSATQPENFIALEKKHWQPFIKAEMDEKKTNQVAWGNELILSPRGGAYTPTTLSFDLFPSFKDALMPSFGENAKFPEEGLKELDKITSAPRQIEIYRIVKVVTKP